MPTIAIRAHGVSASKFQQRNREARGPPAAGEDGYEGLDGERGATQ